MLVTTTLPKFGEKLVFENKGHCVVLKRHEIIQKLYTTRIYKSQTALRHGIDNTPGEEHPGQVRNHYLKMW